MGFVGLWSVPYAVPVEYYACADGLGSPCGSP